MAHVNLIDMNDQLIHVKVDFINTHEVLFATFVYGLHNRTDRKPLWGTLLRLSANIQIPWIVLGDFNTYLSPADKLGGNIIRNYEISDFQECLSIGTRGFSKCWMLLYMAKS